MTSSEFELVADSFEHGREPEKGFRLATYVIWWIKAAIQELMTSSRSWTRKTHLISLRIFLAHQTTKSQRI
jgi:DNA-directed RNA polymerase sigma subunit (sigma70/sigma32)